jgi:hypothetical protein
MTVNKHRPPRSLLSRLMSLMGSSLTARWVGKTATWEISAELQECLSAYNRVPGSPFAQRSARA